MPTTSTEGSTRTTSLQAAQGDAFDEAQQLLAGSEASGEAISEAVQALSELVRAVLPAVVTQPARAADLAFELVQQSLNLQRRLLHELLAMVQVAMVEAGWESAGSDLRAGANNGSARRRNTRKAA